MNLVDRIFAREEMDGDGACSTYLIRWTLLRIRGFAIYLHKFVGDDWAVDLHDHPKRFISIGLSGGYTEWTTCDDCGVHVPRVYRAPWVRTFPAEHRHRLSGPTPDHPCWTLVAVLRTVRPWGFWLRGEWIPWRKYVADHGAARRSC